MQVLFIILLEKEDKFSSAGNSRGSVGPRTTHFSSQKVYFSIDRHDRGGWPYHMHCTASLMSSSWSRDYSVGVSVFIHLVLLRVMVKVVDSFWMTLYN